MNPPPDFMVPVGLDRFAGALRSCNRFLCFNKKQWFFRCERVSQKTRVRVACETFVETRREKMNQMLKNGLKTEIGAKFWQEDFLSR